MTLRLRGITKRYGALRANDGVDLDVAAGELHGLLGENGAGKSTLMKVLSGFIRADAGEVELDGKALTLSSPRDAIAAGIGMLHQDPLVFGPFTVLDNFLLASPGGARLDRRPWTRAARRCGRALRVHVRPRRRGPHAVGRRAPAAGDRPPALARRPGADPRRADDGDLGVTARQAVRHPPPPRRRRADRDLRVAQAGGDRAAVRSRHGHARRAASSAARRCPCPPNGSSR